VSASRIALPLTTLVALVLTAGAASPAAAQSLLKQLAREAALRAAAGAVAPDQTPATESVAGTAQSSARSAESPGAGQDTTESGAPIESGPAPWPINAGASNVRAPGQLKFSADLEKQKADFIEWSRVSCTACEGGRSYDAWAQHFIRTDGSWRAWEKMLGALAVGESVTWQGRSANGRIKVVRETPIAPWACKQLEWSLTRGSESVSRPGLICRGHGDDRSGSTTWTTVF
jgi:hypothetical protein